MRNGFVRIEPLPHSITQCGGVWLQTRRHSFLFPQDSGGTCRLIAPRGSTRFLVDLSFASCGRRPESGQRRIQADTTLPIAPRHPRSPKHPQASYFHPPRGDAVRAYSKSGRGRWIGSAGGWLAQSNSMTTCRQVPAASILLQECYLRYFSRLCPAALGGQVGRACMGWRGPSGWVMQAGTGRRNDSLSPKVE